MSLKSWLKRKFEVSSCSALNTMVPNCIKHQSGESTYDNRRQKAMWKKQLCRSNLSDKVVGSRPVCLQI